MQNYIFFVNRTMFSFIFSTFVKNFVTLPLENLYYSK